MPSAARLMVVPNTQPGPQTPHGSTGVGTRLCCASPAGKILHRRNGSIWGLSLPPAPLLVCCGGLPRHHFSPAFPDTRASTRGPAPSQRCCCCARPCGSEPLALGICLGQGLNAAPSLTVNLPLHQLPWGHSHPQQMSSRLPPALPRACGRRAARAGEPETSAPAAPAPPAGHCCFVTWSFLSVQFPLSPE